MGSYFSKANKTFIGKQFRRISGTKDTIFSKHPSKFPFNPPKIESKPLYQAPILQALRLETKRNHRRRTTHAKALVLWLCGYLVVVRLLPWPWLPWRPGEGEIHFVSKTFFLVYVILRFCYVWGFWLLLFFELFLWFLEAKKRNISSDPASALEAGQGYLPCDEALPTQRATRRKLFFFLGGLQEEEKHGALLERLRKFDLAFWRLRCCCFEVLQMLSIAGAGLLISSKQKCHFLEAAEGGGAKNHFVALGFQQRCVKVSGSGQTPRNFNQNEIILTSSLLLSLLFGAFQSQLALWVTELSWKRWNVGRRTASDMNSEFKHSIYSTSSSTKPLEKLRIKGNHRQGKQRMAKNTYHANIQDIKLVLCNALSKHDTFFFFSVQMKFKATFWSGSDEVPTCRSELRKDWKEAEGYSKVGIFKGLLLRFSFFRSLTSSVFAKQNQPEEAHA